jgi:hypothetical protein
MGGGRERRVGERRHPGRIGVDECLLAGVPGFEHLLVGQAADQTRMNESGEADTRDVAGVRIESGNIPDRFLRQREVIGQAAAILFGKETVEAPRALREDADVENVDDQEIAGLGAMDADRPGQKVHDGKIDVADIVGGFIVLDESAGPIVGLHDEVFARLDPLDDRNVRMPPVMDQLVFVGRFLKVNLHDRLGHDSSLGAT